MRRREIQERFAKLAQEDDDDYPRQNSKNSTRREYDDQNDDELEGGAGILDYINSAHRFLKKERVGSKALDFAGFKNLARASRVLGYGRDDDYEYDQGGVVTYKTTAKQREARGKTVKTVKKVGQTVTHRNGSQHVYGVNADGSRRRKNPWNVFVSQHYDEVADDQSKICKWGSTNETFANWQTAASASHDKNGTITITTNGVVNSSTSSTIANDGTNLLTIVPDDILGNPRTTTPWLGAYEVDSLMLGINNVLASTYYFTIFPSPTNYNNINIAFNNFNESSIVKVELLNITGETICAEEISNNKNIKLNVSSKISSGIYFIKITNKDKVSVKKLVIN